MSLAAGTAAVKDYAYMQQCVATTIENRENTKNELRKLGFVGPDTVTNFVFVKHDKIDAKKMCKELKNRGILVRHYSEPKINDYLRITIGTSDEMKQVIQTIKDIMTDWNIL